MATSKKARLLLLNQAADPFVLRYHLYDSGNGPLFLSPKDDLTSTFYLNPRDNFYIKDLISKPNKNYLVTAQKVGLLTQSDEELLTAIKTDRQRALDFLKEQAPKDKLFGILHQIDPEIKHYNIDRILLRYSSNLSGFQNAPLSIESVCLANAKLTAKEGLNLLKPSEYMSFFENLKASLLGIIVLTVGKLTSLSVKAVQNQAQKKVSPMLSTSPKIFVKNTPKRVLLLFPAKLPPILSSSSLV